MGLKHGKTQYKHGNHEDFFGDHPKKWESSIFKGYRTPYEWIDNPQNGYTPTLCLKQWMDGNMILNHKGSLFSSSQVITEKKIVMVIPP